MKEYYITKVEGKSFKAPFCYEGLRACQEFIHKNGKEGQRYPIKYRKEKDNA